MTEQGRSVTPSTQLKPLTISRGGLKVSLTVHFKTTHYGRL
nr:MAG TPA: hypothetical protein [Caudoviricetes sp.]